MFSLKSLQILLIGAGVCTTIGCTSIEQKNEVSNFDDSMLMQQQSKIPAKKIPTEMNYFGQTISDPYLWMEKDENKPELLEWMRQQGDLTAQWMDNNPFREKIYQRLLTLQSGATQIRNVSIAGDKIFYMYSDETTQVPLLMMQDSSGQKKVLLKPQKNSNGSEEHIAIDGYTPSPDGKFIAYNLSTGGAEITNIHFINTESGEVLPDTLTWIWGEFQASWLPNNSGVIYTRMSRESKNDPSVNKLFDMEVYVHKLGTPESDDFPILGTEKDNGPHFESQEFPLALTSNDPEWVIGYAGGARAERRVFVKKTKDLSSTKTPWTVIADYQDAYNGDIEIKGDSLYYYTTNNAPNGEIRKRPLSTKVTSKPVVVVPESDGVLKSFFIGKKHLYYSVNLNGQSQLYKKSLSNNVVEEIALPMVGDLTLVGIDRKTEKLYFSLQGWTHPKSFFAYTDAQNKVVDLGLKEKSSADFSNIVVERAEAKSHDGVMVPVTLIYQKDLKKDGTNPTIINAYGGYGFPRSPSFSAERLAWLEQGGIYAYAHIRGGGEKGKQWHLDGKGKNKKNGVQDFIAAAEYLIKNNYTSSSHLALVAGSMGGVVIGRAVTERPELFDAAAIHVGMLNILRYLEDQNGANQTAELEATPDSKAGFDILMQMDSVHNIKSGMTYPNIMLIVGLNDQRVAPWHSAKFAANMLDKASKTSRTVLRTSDNEGHGIGSTKNQRLLKMADEWSFYLKEFATK